MECFLFFTLECLYFLCFVHAYFIIIGMNMPQMKSNVTFSDRDIVTGMKYINSPFDQNYHFFHILSYIGLYIILPHYCSRKAPLMVVEWVALIRFLFGMWHY